MKMKWVSPAYPKAAVNRAGEVLTAGDADPFELSHALDVLNNWRAAHALPLNAIQTNLRLSARKICKRPLIAQRLKRTPSVVAKLRRFDKMQLARMQDIGGCRAVLDNAAQVTRLYHHFLHSRIWIQPSRAIVKHARGEEYLIRTDLFDVSVNVDYYSYKSPHYGGAT